METDDDEAYPENSLDDSTNTGSTTQGSATRENALHLLQVDP